MNTMKYGFIKSKIDGTELKFGESKKMQLPASYDYLRNLSPILNQGARSICVPCSISATINWNINMNHNLNQVDHKVDLMSIYSSRSNKSDDGMTFKDAFKFLRNTGVKTDKGTYKIDKYFTIGTVIGLKQAIICNGPCLGALPVYDSNVEEFWDSKKGSLQGGHAIALIGYDKDGFIIRNSWGTGYGVKGYGKLPYDAFENFYELWTFI